MLKKPDSTNPGFSPSLIKELMSKQNMARGSHGANLDPATIQELSVDKSSGTKLTPREQGSKILESPRKSQHGFQMLPVPGNTLHKRKVSEGPPVIAPIIKTEDEPSILSVPAQLTEIHVYSPVFDDLVNTFLNIFSDNARQNELYMVNLAELFYKTTGTRWMVTYGSTYGSMANFLGGIENLFTVALIAESTIVRLNPEFVQEWKSRMEKLKSEQEGSLMELEKKKLAVEQEAKKNRIIDHRKKIIQEIHSTEKTYVSNLSIIVKKHMEPLQNPPSGRKIINEEDFKSIFYLVGSIYALHEMTILPGLEKSLTPEESATVVAKVFTDAQHYFKIYSSFADNYETAASVFRRCSTTPTYSAFLKDVLKDPSCQNLDLLSLLIQPIQRIPRYKLLLGELLKYTPPTDPDYESLTIASESLKKTASLINSRVKTNYIRDKIGKIEGFENYFQPHRHYIAEGTGTLCQLHLNVETALGNCTLILFSDILLICVGRYVITQMQLTSLWVMENDSDMSPLDVTFVDPEVSYRFTGASLETKLQLVNSIYERLIEIIKPGSSDIAKRSIKFKYKDESEYDGEMLNGRRHGRGLMKYKDGAEYDGEWHEDKREGKGFYSRAAGERTEYYDGAWENDEQNGRGIRMYPTGIQVEGLFERGIPVGEVTEISVDGSRYKGRWKNGKRNGFGILEYEKGGRYEGNFVNNLRHGKGYYFLKELGEEYDGEWKHDKFHGYGSYVWSDKKCKYVGWWENGKKSGHGFIKYENGDQYDGDWEADERHGNGIFTEVSTGIIYEGAYVRGKKDGRGKLTLESGDIIVGNWSSGVLCHGAEYTFAEGSKWNMPDL